MLIRRYLLVTVCFIHYYYYYYYYCIDLAALFQLNLEEQCQWLNSP